MIARACAVLLCAALCISPGGAAMAGQAEPGPQGEQGRPEGAGLRASSTVRVGLIVGQESALVGCDCYYEVVDLESGRSDVRDPGRVSVRPSGRGIDVGGAGYGAAVRMLPRGGRMQAAGRAYRGLLEIRRAGPDRLTVVNEVDLEEYLYGVVRSEMDPRWPGEALRAQAIAARSLAVRSSGRFAKDGYDVAPTTDSQVYGGVAAEDPRTSAAVDATRGLILYHGGAPVFAAFHADSGGFTESSEHVWGSAMPYLRGVADPFSKEAPNHAWRVRIDLAAIESALARVGRPLVGLTRVEVVSTSPSGRVAILRLLAASGSLDLRGTEFRAAVGNTTLRSTLFAVRHLGPEGAVELAGRGYGHGVGMSQWGARGMALAGRDYTEILRYYYAGVTVGPRP